METFQVLCLYMHSQCEKANKVVAYRPIVHYKPVINKTGFYIHHVANFMTIFVLQYRAENSFKFSKVVAYTETMVTSF